MAVGLVAHTQSHGVDEPRPHVGRMRRDDPTTEHEATAPLFATTGEGQLSALAVWWLKHGI